jgi:ABC-type antimicrobial peptide transport system permease subunit
VEAGEEQAMSVRDHENEFALLRSMGSSISYFQSIVLVQAAAIAVLGTIIGIGVFLPALPLSRDTPLFLTITPRLIAFVTIATVVIGLISSMGAMYRLHRLDPAMLMR